MKVPEMRDKYVINSGVFYLLGVMVVVPFQFYINSLDFWMYKFQPMSPGGRPPPRPPPSPPPPSEVNTPETVAQQFFSVNNSFQERLNNYTFLETSFYVQNDIRKQTTERSESPSFKQMILRHDNDSFPPDERTPIQANITAGFNVTFKVALLGALLICCFWPHKLPPPEERLRFCLFAICVIFSITTIFTQINSRQMINWFFAGAMFLATLLNFCTGMATASLYEVISKFPPSYYASIQSGNNICGIISSLLQVCLLSIRLEPDVNGAIYFAFGTVILIGTTIYYSFIIKNSKYFIYKINQIGGERNLPKLPNINRPNKTPLSLIIWKIKWHYATLVFVEGTSHVVYPGLAALVVPYQRDVTNIWKEIYFVPVITFLGFQVCNLIGREAARIIKTPKHGAILFVIAALRIILVPLLIFCNAQPRSHLPVLFVDRDFIIILIVLSFSEGILINMAIVAIPTILEKEEDREAIMVWVPLVSAVTVTLASGLNVFITNVI